MHIRWKVLSGKTIVVDAPDLGNPVSHKETRPDNPSSDPIETDLEDNYSGRMSPRLIQWLLDNVRELLLGTNS